MIYTWKSLNDLNCLKQIVQSLVACTQSSFNDPLYGLKQSGHMWYNRLSEYLLKEGYVNNPMCPCIFIKKWETGFAIIAVYVDDLNLIGTPKELTRTINYLKK